MLETEGDVRISPPTDTTVVMKRKKRSVIFKMISSLEKKIIHIDQNEVEIVSLHFGMTLYICYKMQNVSHSANQV